MRFFPRTRRAFLHRALAPYNHPAGATPTVDATPTASAVGVGSAGGIVEPPRPQYRGASRPGSRGERARPSADPSIDDSVTRFIEDLEGARWTQR